MSNLRSYGQDIKRLLPVILILIGARLCYIAFMPAIFSGDMGGWLQVIDVLRAGGDPYTQTEYLNWPPFWLVLLWIIGKTSLYLHISVPRLIQATLILVETGVTIVLYGILQRRMNYRHTLLLLIFGVALNPISILLTCVHCNFDIFVAFWVLLFFLMLLDFQSTGSANKWLWACFFLGIGILTKTVPVVLCPVLLIGIMGIRPGTRISGLLLLLAPAAIGMAIIFAMGPQGVIEHVLLYRSQSGWFGFSGILTLLHADGLIQIYAILSPFIILLVLGYLSLHFYTVETITAQRLLILLILLLLAIPLFGPGYAPQYINWFLPLLVLLYALSAEYLQRTFLTVYMLASLTYFIEYAFCHSHGALLTMLIHTGSIMHWSEIFSSRPGQVALRLPLFMSYLYLFAALQQAYTPDVKKRW